MFGIAIRLNDNDTNNAVLSFESRMPNNIFAITFKAILTFRGSVTSHRLGQRGTPLIIPTTATLPIGSTSAAATTEHDVIAGLLA